MVVRDEVAPVINIHNGDVMAVTARRMGLPGEHLSFRESLVTGPVPATSDWLGTRARFLSAAYGEELLRASNALFEQEQALNAAAESDQEIVLWFEHDLFCLVHFIYLLQRFRQRNVSFVWCSDVLAGREPDDLLRLFNSRAPVTPAMFDIAARAWGAYTSPDPRMLNDLFTIGDELSFLRDGMRLHGSRFPSTGNGLGAVENRLLKLIASGAADFAMLFGQFDERPPRFGFGDAQVLYILRAMASRAVPLITMAQTDETPPKATFAITPAGENVMNGAVDDISVNDPDLWLGGAHVTVENVWRWDESRVEIILSRPAAS